MSLHTELDNSLQTLKNQTRAERRRAEREAKKGQVTYSLTRDSIIATTEKAYKQGRQDAIENEIKFVEETLFNCFVIALHDKEGFGKVRIERVLEAVKSQVECLDLGVISKEELIETTKRLDEKAKAPMKSKK